jgi:hypothetical protein
MESDPAVEALDALVVEDEAAGAELLADVDAPAAVLEPVLEAELEVELAGELELEPLLEPAVLDGEEEEELPLPLTAALLMQLTSTELRLIGGLRFWRPNEKHAATAPSVTLQY